MKSIGQSTVQLPAEVPVMVLPKAVLFPNALMPLYIFEPRYRAMLEHALAKDRVFCVAMMKDGVSEAHSDDDFHHIAGVGLVRACVGREDGTSQLVLQGLARVHFENFVQETPFRIAAIRELRSEGNTSEDIAELRAGVLAACAQIPSGDATMRDNLNDQLEHMEDPGVLCDIVAHTFLHDADRQQVILEETDVSKRLQTLLGFLCSELDL